MRFLGFLTRRIVGIAAVMVGVSIITFAISHIIPADPIAAALGDHATDQQIEAFRSEYHLDRPL
ncbi:MAG: ABC transporter permease, partial [Chloroflexi bacterium]